MRRCLRADNVYLYDVKESYGEDLLDFKSWRWKMMIIGKVNHDDYDIDY